MNKYFAAPIILATLLSLPACTIFPSHQGEVYVAPGKDIQLRTILPNLWTIDPTEGVSINLFTGLLSVAHDVPEGTNFSVYAGDLDATVYVFEQPDMNPLAGYWSETTRFACGTDEEVIPEVPSQEILFFPTRQFTVTYRLFESYRDYWGHYNFDPATGSLELIIHEANFVPDNFDGNGYFEIDSDGTMILRDMWLGTARNTGFGEPAAETGACGHRLLIDPEQTERIFDADLILPKNAHTLR